MRVEAGGKVAVRFQKQGGKAVVKEFDLDADEVAALRGTVRASRAAIHPQAGGVCVPDAGETT